MFVEGISFAQRYALSIDRKMKILALGYKVVEIWEHDFDIMLRLASQEEKDFLTKKDFVDRLDIRDSFFGGRTNAITLYSEADSEHVIRYYDVTSLYPYVNKVSKYPVGHPTIITKDFKDISEYFGFAVVKILPPRKLFFPVLPFRSCGKLKFPLCSRCAELELLTPCVCTDEQRCLTGTYCTVELNKAISKGYRMITLYEVYHYEESSQYDPVTKKGGLFTDYVNTFLKEKTEASGYPQSCITDADKASYVERFYKKENVRLDPTKILKNSGRRATAKFSLNAFWGRFGMREDHKQTKICRNPAEFFEITDDKQYEVSDFHLINDETVSIMYSYVKKCAPANDTISVCIASFTTAYARLELYYVLEMLDEDALYHDTDSVIFRSKCSDPDSDPPLGQYLGDLTDELDGHHITHFVSTGPKSYSYITDDGLESCKVKGFSLNHKASQIINFETMKDMILNSVTPLQGDPENLKTVYTVKKAKISRDKNAMLIYNKPEVKAFKPIYTKRVVRDDLSTVPYGY